MKRLLNYFFIALGFYCIQIVVEILVNLFLEYSNIKRSEEFTSNILFTEVLLHISWVTIYIKLFLSWLYFIVFIILRVKLNEKVRYSYINLASCLASSIITLFYKNNLTDILSFLLPIILASILIILGELIILKIRKK